MAHDSGGIWRSDYPTLDGVGGALAAAANRTLFIDQDDTIAADITVGSTVAVEFTSSYKWTINTGVTVTFNGQLVCGAKQIFVDNSGDLTKGVKFNVSSYTTSNYLLYVRPEWWGAVANGVDDCATAFSQAFNCFSQSSPAYMIPMQLSSGGYRLASAVQLPAYGQLLGNGKAGGLNLSEFQQDNSSSYALFTNNALIHLDWLAIKDITFKAGTNCSGRLVNIVAEGTPPNQNQAGGGTYSTIHGCKFDTSASGYPTDNTGVGLWAEFHKSQVHDNEATGPGSFYHTSNDGWTYDNELTHTGTKGSTCGLVNEKGTFDGNTISGFYYGMITGWDHYMNVYVNGHTISDCTVGIRDNGQLTVSGKTFDMAMSGFISDNTISNCTTAYSTDFTPDNDPAFGMVMYKNTFNTNTTAINDANDSGLKIIAENTGTGNTDAMTGAGIAGDIKVLNTIGEV